MCYNYIYAGPLSISSSKLTLTCHIVNHCNGLNPGYESKQAGKDVFSHVCLVSDKRTDTILAGCIPGMFPISFDWEEIVYVSWISLKESLGQFSRSERHNGCLAKLLEHFVLVFALDQSLAMETLKWNNPPVQNHTQNV